MKIILLFLLGCLLLKHIFRLIKLSKTKIASLYQLETIKPTKQGIAHVLGSIAIMGFIIYIYGLIGAYRNNFGLLFISLLNLTLSLSNILVSYTGDLICNDFIKINASYIPFKNISAFEWVTLGEQKTTSKNRIFLKIWLKEDEQLEMDFRTNILLKLNLITFESRTFTFAVEMSDRNRINEYLYKEVV